MLLFLLPPSEGKNTGWIDTISTRTFDLDLPLDIAAHATHRDLKCKGKRYQEGVELNRRLAAAMQTPTPEGTPSPWQGTTSDWLSPWVLVMPAIQRYSGVMYKAIGYSDKDAQVQQFFDTHVLILSGMYWLLTPQDTIANYKLPIGAKWLRQWRGTTITDALISYCADQDQIITIVDLLSGAYSKMIQQNTLRDAGIRYITVDFVKTDGSKYTHWVKKVKGEMLLEWCIAWVENVKWLEGEVDGDVVRVVC